MKENILKWRGKVASFGKGAILWVPKKYANDFERGELVEISVKKLITNPIEPAINWVSKITSSSSGKLIWVPRRFSDKLIKGEFVEVAIKNLIKDIS